MTALELTGSKYYSSNVGQDRSKARPDGSSPSKADDKPKKADSNKAQAPKSPSDKSSSKVRNSLEQSTGNSSATKNATNLSKTNLSKGLKVEKSDIRLNKTSTTTKTKKPEEKETANGQKTDRKSPVKGSIPDGGSLENQRHNGQEEENLRQRKAFENLQDAKAKEIKGTATKVKEIKGSV